MFPNFYILPDIFGISPLPVLGYPYRLHASVAVCQRPMAPKGEFVTTGSNA